jgi:hypothetical protein
MGHDQTIDRIPNHLSEELLLLGKSKVKRHDSLLWRIMQMIASSFWTTLLIWTHLNPKSQFPNPKQVSTSKL